MKQETRSGVEVADRVCSKRLIVFPFAGGAANDFHFLKKAFSENVEVILYELPGRGRRYREPLLECWDAVATDALLAFGHLVDRPTVFYGHSFGALVAFEVTKRLANRGLNLPRQVIVGSSQPPNTRSVACDLIKLSDEELFLKLIEFDSILDEFAGNAEIRDFILPKIRADLKLSQYYELSNVGKLHCGITVLFGASDKMIDQRSMALWTNLTGKGARIVEMKGGHMFQREFPSSLISAIRGELDRLDASLLEGVEL